MVVADCDVNKFTERKQFLFFDIRRIWHMTWVHNQSASYQYWIHHQDRNTYNLCPKIRTFEPLPRLDVHSVFKNQFRLKNAFQKLF